MNAVEREGGDITAADMVHTPTEPSQIQGYFKDAVVFVTGATGCIGKLLVEKLLRVCKVSKIYVLLRAKDDKTGEERFRDYFEDVVFERLRRENVQSLRRVEAVVGDCAKVNLGLGDLNQLGGVNCVFHCASTGYFDDDFLEAILVNVRGVQELLGICRKMTDLRVVDEELYPVHLSGDDLLTLVGILKDEMVEDVASVVKGSWPNIYTFTKAVAEDAIKCDVDQLPLAVVRPSLVIGTAKEPVSGWINSFRGASGVFAGISLGLIRTMHLEPNNLADLVPADYVSNCMLAVSHDIALKKSINLNSEVSMAPNAEVPIYNYVSTPQKPISWRSALEMVVAHMEEVPLSYQIWHALLLPTSNKYLFWVLQFLLHWVPGAITRLDKRVSFYVSLTKFLSAFTYFTSKQWIFCSANTETLWEKLNGEDKKCFEFGMYNFDWDLYFRTNVRGLRVYLLKDPIGTLDEGDRRRRMLQIWHYGLIIALMCVMAVLLT